MAVLRGGANDRSIRLRQADDKAIVGEFESKRISSPQPCGANRRANFGDGPDFAALAEDLVRDWAARAGAMEHQIVVDDFAGQPGAPESGPHARRQSRGAIQGIRAATGRTRDDPRSASGHPRIRRRHGYFGDDGLASEEQRLDDRALSGGSTRQHIRIAKVFRQLGPFLTECTPLDNGPAGDGSCQDGTKVATAGASHFASSPISLVYRYRPELGPAVTTPASQNLQFTSADRRRNAI
jgi:hypothetical protein